MAVIFPPALSGGTTTGGAEVVIIGPEDPLPANIEPNSLVIVTSVVVP